MKVVEDLYIVYKNHYFYIKDKENLYNLMD